MESLIDQGVLHVTLLDRAGTPRWEREFPNVTGYVPLSSEEGAPPVLALVREGALEHVVLAREDGHTVTSRQINTAGLATACATRGGPSLLAVVDDAQVKIFDLDADEGAPIYTTNESWSECALAQHEGTIVLAGARAERYTSAGPLTSLQVRVLAADGHEIRRLAPRDEGGYGARIRAFGDHFGLIWTDMSRWHFMTWSLDARGQPEGVPRYLETVYFFPSYEVDVGAQGLELVWRNDDDGGVVPLCHAAERNEPAPPSRYGGMGITLY